MGLFLAVACRDMHTRHGRTHVLTSSSHICFFTEALTILALAYPQAPVPRSCGHYRSLAGTCSRAATWCCYGMGVAARTTRRYSTSRGPLEGPLCTARRAVGRSETCSGHFRHYCSGACPRQQRQKLDPHRLCPRYATYSSGRTHVSTVSLLSMCWLLYMLDGIGRLIADARRQKPLTLPTHKKV